MKVLLKQQHLNKLEIVDQLRRMRNQLNTSIPQDLDTLAARLTCDKNDLLDVLESMNVDIIEG